MSILAQFLNKNQITKANPLPLVHTTASYHLKKIVSQKSIVPRPCNVFAGESLSYFFVGRAAYKKESFGEAEYWELPACVVLEFFSERTKRIFPFDSGAFSGNRYPEFIQMMEMKDFEIVDDIEAPQKLIGTFFRNSQNYYRLRCEEESEFNKKFDVDILDEEIKALHSLIRHKNNNYDDRRFSIEMQFSESVDLNIRRPIAIILPENYLENGDYIKKIESLGARVIIYPIYPLRKEYFYYAIYQKLDELYKEIGAYNV